MSFFKRLGVSLLKSGQIVLQGLAEDLGRANGVFALLQVGDQLRVGVVAEIDHITLVGFLDPPFFHLGAGGGLAVGY